jgi:hypothetical protein
MDRANYSQAFSQFSAEQAADSDYKTGAAIVNPSGDG